MVASLRAARIDKGDRSVWTLDEAIAAVAFNLQRFLQKQADPSLLNRDGCWLFAFARQNKKAARHKKGTLMKLRPC